MLDLPKPKEILNIDETVRPGHVEDDIFKICSQILKDIKKDDMVFEQLRGGYVNLICKVSIKNFKGALCFRNFGFKISDTGINKDENQLSNSDFDKELFDRLAEFRIMAEVSRNGLCESVYARYNNGICYGFASGVTCDGPLMLTNDFLNEMAPKLARFHCIQPLEEQVLKYKTHYDKMNALLDPIIDKLVETFDEKMKGLNEFPFNGEFPLISTLIEEKKKIVDLLNRVGMGEIVFAHNDTNQKNIIWNPQTRSVSFIDFETQPNYDAMEIGALLFNFAGHFLYNFDADFYPNDEYRKSFLRSYLTEVHRCKNIVLKPEEFEEKVLRYFIQTNLASLYHMLRVAAMCPVFDVNPDLFRNEDLEQSRKTIKYFCSIFGLKVYKLYEQKKDEFIRLANNYMEKH